MEHIIFLIRCHDQRGLVARISTFFFNKGLNILACQEHVDEVNHSYFMRLKLSSEGLSTSRQVLEQDFSALADELGLNWSVNYSDYLPKVAILVTKTPHCLYDLLVRHEQNELKCDVRLVISNHRHLESVAEKFRIPFYYLPVVKTGDKAVDAQNRKDQEAQIDSLLQQHYIDLTILARYMMILSQDFISRYPGRIINVHHAILPAFKGANPYRRAFDRGVKMIGATAHYATEDLDEGPIIEQDVERVTHESGPKELVRIGADIERIVLARAVKAHLESRIIIEGNKTVVFS